MTTSDMCALSCYRKIADIDTEHDVVLVQHTGSGRVYVKKELTVYNAGVFRYLQAHHVKGTPEICEVFETDGRLTVIEEYISGQTLRAILDNGNRFSPEEAARIIEKLCGIVQQLHSLEPPILHRDIKPSNIMLTADGEIKLLDMNAAKNLSTDKPEDTSLIGTVGYAAPEQFGFGASTIQTDIYSIGVVFCELVTGRLPKEEIPAGKAGDIIRKCTQIDPAKRYKNVVKLREAAAGLLEEKPPGYSSGSAGTEKYMLPGFRTKNPTNIIIAVCGYASLIYLSAVTTAKGIPAGLLTYIMRCGIFVYGVILILFSANYLNVWDSLRISRIRNVWVRTFVIVLADVLFSLLSLVLMTILLVLMGA